MRTDKVMKNSFYAFVSFFLTAMAAILVRKLFVLYLPVELLGYEGLFGNIFSLLALADFGVEGLIKYRMYPAFASDNKDEICRLMSMYRLIYRFVGGFVLITGIVLIPFLRFIIKDNSLDWNYIYVIFAIQLTTTLCTYFLAYKRILFVVDQCEYKCIKVDAACSILSYLFQIIVILVFKSYILYLLVKVFTNLMANGILARRAGREYNYINNYVKITRNDIAESGLLHDIKNNMVQKVASTVWSSTDNILISALLGISNVGLLTNYSLVTGYVTSILDKVLNPFQASIGNLVYSDDRGHGNRIFHMFDMLGFFLASFVACSYFALLNPLISLWLGEEFTVGQGYVLALVLNQYIMWNHRFVLYYRESFGKYELDRNYILIGAFLNIACSVLLAKPLGIAGIMLGTAISHMGFWVGRAKMVYQEYVQEKIRYYVVRQVRNIVILSVELLLINMICGHISDTYLGFLEKMLICIILPNGINFFLFCRTKEMKMAYSYVEYVFRRFRKD